MSRPRAPARRAYLALKYHADQRNRAHIEQITATLAESGVAVFCVMRDVEAWGRVSLDPAALMRASFEAIDASDLLLVDLTEKGVGIGIEAGYAYARGIPIVTIVALGADLSTTLEGISTSVTRYAPNHGLAEVVEAVRACPVRPPSTL